MSHLPRLHVVATSRRDFLKKTLLTSSPLILPCRSFAFKNQESLSFAVFTDCHFADNDPLGTRHYRESKPKLESFIQTMNQEDPAFCVTLGDFYDSGPSVEKEVDHIQRIHDVFRQFTGKRHVVLGNHDLTRIDKARYLGEIQAEKAHYSFDQGSYHFLILDANYRKDFEPYVAGNFQWTESFVCPKEQAWLKADLDSTNRPTVAFIHQRLDADHDPHGVGNASEVRKILESSGRVRAVFQGHDHRGALTQWNGIYYVTLRAMVEGPYPTHNAFAKVLLQPDKIEVQGFFHQPTMSLPGLK